MGKGEEKNRPEFLKEDIQMKERKNRGGRQRLRQKLKGPTDS